MTTSDLHALLKQFGSKAEHLAALELYSIIRFFQHQVEPDPRSMAELGTSRHDEAAMPIVVTTHPTPHRLMQVAGFCPSPVEVAYC